MRQSRHNGRLSTQGLANHPRLWLRRDLNLPEHQELAWFDDPARAVELLADPAAEARSRLSRATAPTPGHHQRPR